MPKSVSAVLLAATGAASMLVWNSYVTTPLSRDDRVRMQVAKVAPQVSGQIVEVRVADDQRVRRGDVLYRIESFDFSTALTTARA